VQSANKRAHRKCSGCQEILKSCTVVTGIAHLKACGKAKQKHPGMVSILEHNKVRTSWRKPLVEKTLMYCLLRHLIRSISACELALLQLVMLECQT